MNQLKIRNYQETDAQDLADIYYHTIHNINIRDYSQKQVNAWAPPGCRDIGGWKKRWEKLVPLVATCDGKVIGFAEFEDNGHIDCFYIHHQFQNKGAGSSLLAEIENIAERKNIKRIFAEVSITAKEFFLSKGFLIVKEQTVKKGNVELRNFVMEKI